MAISGGDGSIILSTKVDTSGINKGMNSIKSIVSNIGAAIGVAFGVSALVRFGKAATELASDLQEVQNVVDVAFGEMSYKIEQFSKMAIEQFGLSELTAKQWASTMLAMSNGMGQALDVGSDMAIELTGRLADVMSFWNKSEEEAYTLGKAIYSGETEPLKNIGVIMTENNLALFAMSKGYKQAYKDMDATNKLLVRQQFFLEQTASAAGDYVRTQDGWANSVRTLQQRWKEMQTLFGEAFMMLGTLILPAVNSLINGLTKVAEIAKIAASNIYKMFTGKEFNSASKTISQNSNAISETTEAQEGLTEEVEETAKAQEKSLAGFDEIQILSDKTLEQEKQKNQSKGANGALNLLGAENEQSAKDKTSEYTEIASAIKDTLADILEAAGKALMAVGLIVLFSGNVPGGVGLILAGATAYVSGDVIGSDNPLETLKGYLEEQYKYIVPALFGLGVLLMFYGQIGLGIGLIFAGIAVWSIKEVQSEEYETASFKDKLNTIMEAVSLGLLAVGVMVIFFGQIPLGIGMIFAGIAVWSIKEVQSEEYETASFKDKLNTIMEAVSLGLLAVGVMMIFFGQILLGIGMIVAGKSLLSATEEKIKEGEVTTKIKKFIDDNKKLIVGISSALLIIGFILITLGIITPLSIGLLVAGGIGLTTTATIDNTTVGNLIKEFIKTNSGLIIGIASALIVVGVVLIATGVTLPLGIGMIVAGGALLATEAVLNWELITESIKTFFKNNLALIVGVASALLILGIILCCTGVALPLGIGLIAVGATVLVTEATLNWEYISEQVGSFLEGFLKFIEENAIFLVVLGFLLILTGVGVGLGFGLLIVGGVTLVDEVEFAWDWLLEQIKEVWKLIVKFWDENIADIFTKEWWLNLAITCGNGLIEGFEDAINGIIDMFETMINWVVEGLNKISFEVPDWVPGIGGSSFGFNLSKVDFGKIDIPELTQGKVTPTNREFLAGLGDQKKGVNIETSLDTTLNARSSANENININFTGNLAQLARVLKPEISRENNRVGSNLATGGNRY